MVQGFDANLEQALLTMDVVDSLRHEEQMLEKVSDIDTHTLKLTDRLRRLYRQQGIEVSDQIIQEGVKAKLEERFIHKPKRGFTVTLAKLYVDRLTWLKRGALTGSGILAAWGLFFIFVILPQYWASQNLEDEVARVDRFRTLVLETAPATQEKLDSLPTATGRVKTSILEITSSARANIADATSIANSIPSPIHGEIDRRTYLEKGDDLQNQIDEADHSLNLAKAHLDTASSLLSDARSIMALHTEWSSLSNTVAEGSYSDNYRRLLKEHETAALTALLSGDVGTARTHNQKLATLLNNYSQLLSLEGEASSVRDVGLAEAKNTASKEAIQAQFALVTAAISESDLTGAQVALADLRNSVEGLITSYSLRIYSGNKSRSGVWRHPNGDRSKRNYYLVVEAVNPSGRIIRLPIRSEETGDIERVTRFGIRVPETVYESVKQDKLDNNLIDNTFAGEKKRGETEPRWAFKTAGGMITRW